MSLLPVRRLPSELTYNDLNGGEAIEILTDWFRQLLSSQPYLQPHLTLPMAKLTLNIDVGIDMFIGGTVPVASPPDHLDISGNVRLSNSLSLSGGSAGTEATTLRGASTSEQSSVLTKQGSASMEQGRASTEHRSASLSTVVNASPSPGGTPPDAIRAQHDLPIPHPGYGPRETGSHLFLSDIVEATHERKLVLTPAPEPVNASGGREGIVADGYVFAQESPGQPLEQSIEVDRGAIDIDLTGAGRMREGGMIVTAGTHIASKKKQGDQAGGKYGSVAATYDAGPAGLAQPGRSGGGLYSDGRSKIAFGNQRS